LRLAIRISGIEGLALTKLDVLAGLPAIKICTGYDLRGRTLDEMPLDLEDLAEARPLYEEHPGWADVSPTALGGELSEASLPTNARAFMERLSQLVGIPIWVASVGPARTETIVRHNPFSSGRPARGRAG
jgi:adenylosuccinate synthase